MLRIAAPLPGVIQACRKDTDGEIFTQYLIGEVRGLRHATEIPFSLELIDPDQIPLDYSDSARRITQGVGKNGWGRALAYYLTPADSGVTVRQRYIEVPADSMQHLKMTKRLRQTRGVSVFASTLERVEDTRDYDESERMAAKMAAKVVGAIKRGMADQYEPPRLPDGGAAEPEPREINFQSGMWFDDLLPGEEPEVIDTNRTNPNLGRYRDDMIRAMAAGIGCSFSSLSRNHEGTYSSRRQEASEQDPHYAVLWGYFVERAGPAAVWSGAPAGGRGRRHPVRRGFLPPDPAPDRPPERDRANADALESFQDTLVDIWRRRGRRPADMWVKLQDQAEHLQDIQGAAPQQAPAATPDPDDDEAEAETEEAA